MEKALQAQGWCSKAGQGKHQDSEIKLCLGRKKHNGENKKSIKQDWKDHKLIFPLIIQRQSEPQCSKKGRNKNKIIKMKGPISSLLCPPSPRSCHPLPPNNNFTSLKCCKPTITEKKNRGKIE